MELRAARKLAEQIVVKVAPFCDRVAVAGSIRREIEFPRDIDIVAIPNNQGQFLVALQSLGKIKSGAGKLINVILPNGVSVDFYIATEQTWPTLLLIRTGSKRHNIHMCKRARDKGMVLHADGRGLARLTDCQGTEHPVPCYTEDDIFKEMEMPYKAPWERE
ncbi:MAG: hypothetical protein M0Q12_00860 [Synergistaceae bacterium]|nr:hypothetical protein [Synergistaceae bacterium]